MTTFKQANAPGHIWPVIIATTPVRKKSSYYLSSDPCRWVPNLKINNNCYINNKNQYN